MNVLFISHYSGMYGANQSLCKLIVELRDSYNINPFVLLPSHGPICDFLEKANIRYEIKHYYWWVNENKGLFQYLLNWRKQILNRNKTIKIVSEFKEQTFDLVYTNSITINIGSLIARKMNIPHIWHIRESMVHYCFKFAMGFNISREFLNKGADCYIVISDFLRSSYKDLLPQHKTFRIYNGISLHANNTNFRKEPHSKIKLCISGIVSEQKNQMDAIRAMNYIVNELHIKEIELHIAGTGKSDYLINLKKTVDQYNLNLNIFFHGHVEEMNILYRQSDIGLMCSRDEAFGRVSIEYMLSGMPVIASNSGANPEIILNGENGFIYEIYNYRQLGDIIVNFINNRNLITHLGNNARLFAENNFSSEANTKAIYQLIEKHVKPK